jgi:hypothetical protein
VLAATASDAWGYLSQADLWLARDLTVEQPIAADVPWPNAGWTFAPLGYRPAPDDPAVIVPTYPPGLPVLMAIGKRLVGTCGPFSHLAASGWPTIWFTYLLGSRVASRMTGLAAAALLATSPIFSADGRAPVSATCRRRRFWCWDCVLALSRRAVALLFWTGAAVSMVDLHPAESGVRRSGVRRLHRTEPRSRVAARRRGVRACGRFCGSRSAARRWCLPLRFSTRCSTAGR